MHDKDLQDDYKNLENEHLILRGKFQQALESLEALDIEVE